MRRTLFEADSKLPHRKVVLADAQIQTDAVKRFRLGTNGKFLSQKFHNLRVSTFKKLILSAGLDDIESTKDLIETLKFSLQTCSTGG